MLQETNPEVRHIFSVDVEEYFQVEAFSGVVSRGDWDRYPSRVEGSSRRLLDILSRHGVQGTFFILGCLAERLPGLVKEISRAGHEVASHGYDHTMVTTLTPASFREDIRKSRRILEDITGRPVRGYRAPTFSITERTSWTYGILLQEGYSYSSSVFPVLHDRYGWPAFGDSPRKMGGTGEKEIWEIPMSVGSFGPLRVPFGGGGYLRIYPMLLTKAMFRRFHTLGRTVVVYVHPWELDREQPEIRAPFLRRIRHRFGIAKMEGKLTELLSTNRFGSAALHLDAVRNGKGRS